MKRFLLLILTACFIFSLSACTQSYERADEQAKGFITALLLRDEAAMTQFLHPDFTEEALPDDKFYETLKEQYLTIGHPLTSLSGVGKTKIEDMQGAMRCTYVARVNELFYTVELIILYNDNGYGIVSVAMVLNTDLDLYYNEEQVD